MGWADLWAEQCLKLYDVAGAVPIITGAGGFVSDWNGKPIGQDFDGYAVGASHKALALEVLAILHNPTGLA